MNEPCPKCGEYHNQCFELKQLTDEEIRQCILEYFESPEYKQYPLPVVSVKFARAILRKAQEK